LCTRPDPVWQAQSEEFGTTSGDYRCEEYGKLICCDDANAIADALERAALGPLPAPRVGPVLIREDMTAEQHPLANVLLSRGFLEEFISFLRKGEFSFFWDD
jgi:hypothetical protein